jgi:hypothetical protein
MVSKIGARIEKGGASPPPHNGVFFGRVGKAVMGKVIC